MSLAIFDLDNTLIGGDSDYLWGQFLGEIGIVAPETYSQENERFYRQYLTGTLDIYEFLKFQLAPLAQHNLEDLHLWRSQFLETKIRPILLPKAIELLQQHRQQGATLLIITATNSFITNPIARMLGVDNLIATEPELVDGSYTGNVSGIPSFASGKVKRLHTWLEQHQAVLNGSWFYSDSHNDIPLLEFVSHPIAVDPDEKLHKEATKRGWDIISLR
ncbi:MAG: HAD family hydrolase [Gammaproteobacteria bacterium]|nr:HAD family hydrolase [Gammaproteobacteria bacterium]